MVFRNYSQDKDKLKSFIEEYFEDSDDGKRFIYKDQILTISKREQSSIYINLDHLNEYDDDLTKAVLSNGVRYQKIMYEAIDEILHDIGDIVIKDAFDIFIDHRIRTEQALRQNENSEQQSLTLAELRERFPAELLRRYECYFSAGVICKSTSIRKVLSCEVGKIVRIRGIVTRATQIKPLIKVCTYTCDRCGAETYQEVTSKTFLPLDACLSVSCKNETSKQGGRLHMQTKGSKQVRLQELRVQELSEQVPVGNIPRSLAVHCVGSNTELVQPGDHVDITGVFLPMANSGFNAMFQGLTMETFIEAHSITRISKDDKDELIGIMEPTAEELEQLRDPDMYNLMARSVAPEIFGHEDIKKALLVMMAGGSSIASHHGKIRGTINICLMGDPGVAKSQLLGFIDRLSLRSQYTTGRGSSGVGLTASVVKDQLTGEMTLEAGSLVLADGGVCCIDEFDKMAESDRTAIHEVMEQQTISIAKAGIMTTLNARTSILAAANPAFGRYNSRRSIEQNINLPAALLSRFDLIWLIQDKPNKDSDLRLAQHITYVHKNNEAPAVANATTLLSMTQLRRYLAIIRMQPDPIVPNSLISYIAGTYVSMRKESRSGNKKETLFTSPRTLLALLRIATAVARIRLQKIVDRNDVDEAIRLLDASKYSAKTADVNPSRVRIAYKEVIYQAIRQLATETGVVRMADVSKKCVTMGYTPDQINEVIDSYEELNIWMINVGRTKLTMVS